MHRLKQAYRGERAVVIFGGPSLIEQRFDFAALRKRGFVLFLDTKALTPRFRSFGIEPDFWLMLFPEKSKDNSLQHYIFRSFLAQMRISPFLKRAYRPVLEEMRDRFDRYFEPWRPHRGPHKRYRWKDDVYLQDSPFDVIRQMPQTKIIVNRSLLARHFPNVALPNLHYYYDQAQEPAPFTLERYYTPLERDGELLLQYNAFLNSAAIVLYTLLHFMGFAQVYFLGMDMSMLGSFEYAALYTFKSMLHFRWFFHRSQHVFNADYKPNRPFYRRPQSEFADARLLLSQVNGTQFTRVYQPFKYAAPLDGIPTISMDAFDTL